jgi:hypothetical protein
MEKYNQVVYIKINLYASLIRGESFENRPIPCILMHIHKRLCCVLTYTFVYKEYITAFELHVETPTEIVIRFFLYA